MLIQVYIPPWLLFLTNSSRYMCNCCANTEDAALKCHCCEKLLATGTPGILENKVNHVPHFNQLLNQNKTHEKPVVSLTSLLPLSFLKEAPTERKPEGDLK